MDWLSDKGRKAIEIMGWPCIDPEKGKRTGTDITRIYGVPIDSVPGEAILEKRARAWLEARYATITMQERYAYISGPGVAVARSSFVEALIEAIISIDREED